MVESSTSVILCRRVGKSISAADRKQVALFAHKVHRTIFVHIDPVELRCSQEWSQNLAQGSQRTQRQRGTHSTASLRRLVEACQVGGDPRQDQKQSGLQTNKQIGSQLGDAWLGCVCLFAVFAATQSCSRNLVCKRLLCSPPGGMLKCRLC